jgi:hypothetical protein
MHNFKPLGLSGEKVDATFWLQYGHTSAIIWSPNTGRIEDLMLSDCALGKACGVESGL